MLRLFFLAAAMIGCVSLSGCDFPEIKRPPTGNFGGMDNDLGTQMSGGGASQTDPPAVQPPAASPAPQQPPEGRRAVQVGDGRKGHYGRMSIFDAPISSFFRTKENLTYNVQIPHAMNLYKATNGRAPQSHDEFWREIIQANNLKMPDLKDGCHYEYNPQEEVLEVVYPLD